MSHSFFLPCLWKLMYVSHSQLISVWICYFPRAQQTDEALVLNNTDTRRREDLKHNEKQEQRHSGRKETTNTTTGCSMHERVYWKLQLKTCDQHVDVWQKGATRGFCEKHQHNGSGNTLETTWMRERWQSMRLTGSARMGRVEMERGEECERRYEVWSSVTDQTGHGGSRWRRKAGETVKTGSQCDSRVLNLEATGRKVRPLIQNTLPEYPASLKKCSLCNWWAPSAMRAGPRLHPGFISPGHSVELKTRGGNVQHDYSICKLLRE